MLIIRNYIILLALMMALKLNEKLLTQQVIETIPYKESKSLCTSLIKHISNFINYLIYK